MITTLSLAITLTTPVEVDTRVPTPGNEVTHGQWLGTSGPRRVAVWKETHELYLGFTDDHGAPFDPGATRVDIASDYVWMGCMRTSDRSDGLWLAGWRASWYTEVPNQTTVSLPADDGRLTDVVVLDEQAVCISPPIGTGEAGVSVWPEGGHLRRRRVGG